MFPRRRDYSARWQLSYTTPTLRGDLHLSVRPARCWGTRVLTDGSSMPAGSAQECGQISSKISGNASTAADGKMPLDVTPPRATRFGSPLVLARVHWVRPELVVEVAYLTWTDDGLLGFVGQFLLLHELRVAEREARKERRCRLSRSITDHPSRHLECRRACKNRWRRSADRGEPHQHDLRSRRCARGRTEKRAGLL